MIARNTLQLSDDLVTELLAADHIVIATPVYNYNVPASLEVWVDHIVRKGRTLGFDGLGLVSGKRASQSGPLGACLTVSQCENKNDPIAS
jgi:FMN-dependent NADH-azoreductase